MWLTFCTRHNIISFPATEHALYLFVASISLGNRTFSTAKTYLAAIAYAHNTRGIPLDVSLMTQVQRALRGLKRHSTPTRLRLPLTISILHQLQLATLQSNHTTFDKACLWACFTLAFFGFFRIGELLLSPAGHYVRSHDVSVTNKGLTIFLRSSKTDPLAKGSLVSISPSHTKVCAVSALSEYLPGRVAMFPPGPLFVMNNGTALTPGLFNQLLRELLDKLGLNSSNYSSHSFRAGAATTAAAAGMPAWLIKALGRWSSEAYQVYISTPKAVLETIPSRLCGMVHGC